MVRERGIVLTTDPFCRARRLAIMSAMPELEDWIRAEARSLGFERVGIARAERDAVATDRLEEWLHDERHGRMGYLAREAARRGDPSRLLEGARSAIVVGARYPRADERDSVAAYARLEDYHLRMTEALRELERRIASRQPEARGVVAVDTKPFLERAFAERAGLGWIGKNTMLMDVELGPWTMLGVLLTTLELEPDARQPSRCGTCTSCLDVCPTRAFVAPYVLDARRCLSYWTIEHRGPWPVEFREAVGHRVFGCDDCLTACPFPKRRDGEPSTLLPIANELSSLHPREVLARCAESFQRHFKRYAIQRAGKAGLVRNAITALGNIGDREDFARIEPWLAYPDRGVVIHAIWALGRIGGDEAKAALARLRSTIDDAEALAELDSAILGAERDHAT